VTDRTVVYLDASAIAKLIIEEPGSEELDRYLRTRPLRITSRIGDVEVRRAVARLAEADVARLERVLDTLSLIELDASLARTAGGRLPAGFRTLDAIHVASAQSVASQLEAFVTYDRRLADAAAAAGITVATPGGFAGTRHRARR
jgi:predicted nucleic acid-binding protein